MMIVDGDADVNTAVIVFELLSGRLLCESFVGNWPLATTELL